MKRRVLLLAASLAFGVADARADTSQSGSYAGRLNLLAGPVLMGDRIAWAADSPPEGVPGDLRWTTRLYSAPVGGGPATTLADIATATDDGTYPQGDAVVALAGSPTNVAWLTFAYDVAASKYVGGVPNPWRVSTLTPAGVRPLCQTESKEHGFALDGTTLALSGCEGGITVRDLAGSAPEVLAPTGGPVKLAGPWAAWRTATGYELLNRVTGARTTLGPLPDPPPLSAPAAFGLSPEGVLAANVAVDKDRRLAWASAADPQWHTVSVPDIDWVQEPRVRGGRAVVTSYDRATAAERLWLVDLAGTRTLLAERADVNDDVADTAYDFDGTHVTWASTTCDTLTVTARPVAAGPFKLPSRSHCPVAVDPGAVRVAKRTATVRLRCPAPTPRRTSDRCAGTATLRTSGGRRLGSGPFKIAADRYGTARVKLTGHVPRRVRIVARSVTRGHASRTTVTRRRS